MYYIGASFIFIRFHAEDELSSISYLALGSPKAWYVVSGTEESNFEAVFASELVHQHMQCALLVKRIICMEEICPKSNKHTRAFIDIKDSV